MERKVAWGTMLTLIVVGMLALTTSIQLVMAPGVPGDVYGPEGKPDGKVDGRDIAFVAGCFATKPGDARWNATADLNVDLKIDGRDLWFVASNFGKTDP